MSIAADAPMRTDPVTMPPGAWIDWGGQGTPLHFGHANGFPPRTYGAFLRNFLADFSVASMESRPLWPGADPTLMSDWSPMMHDLRVAIDNHQFRGGVGVGHSLGAITSLWAASEDPGLFKALVLVDPSFFNGPISFAWKWLQRLQRVDRAPIVAGALRRRDRWNTLDEARKAWRNKSLFKPFRDECFDAYLDTGLIQAPEGGFVLRYPKAWEAAIFRVTPADPWDWVRRSRVPTLLVRGEQSDALTRSAVRKFDRLIPNGESIEVPGTGHMLPLQQPGAVSDVILRWLQDAKIHVSQISKSK